MFSYSTLITPKKLCINCKYYISNKRECALFGETNLVNGENSYSYAISARNNDKKCGEEAKYFVENEYKFLTVPYYFFKDSWPLISFISIYSAFIIYANIQNY
jgi:hypothetical protein